MNRFLSTLAILATLTVIVFASLDRRDGLWHKAEQGTPQPTETQQEVTTSDTTSINSLSIEIEPLGDTINIDI